jgi:small subunit ribosomal protein S6
MRFSKRGEWPGYECIFVTKNEWSDEEFKTMFEKIKGIIVQFSGKVVLTEDWGSRKLAYPIEKDQRAKYTYLVYTGTSGVVEEMERQFRLSDKVIRFLTVQLDQEFDDEAFLKHRSEVKAASKKREEERESRREEREARRGEYHERRSSHASSDESKTRES